MASSAEERLPEGIFSLLDTDTYKLTMQSAVLRCFPKTHVTYSFTNRTLNMKLSRAAFKWLSAQVARLANITLSSEELTWLRKTLPYLSAPYLDYLSSFRLHPDRHVKLDFVPDSDTDSDEDRGQLKMAVGGLWVETILYEIPLLALTSEAYFKFCDRDWTYDGQLEKARDKGLTLLKGGCVVSDFGTRRRRDLHTQELVIRGLVEAAEEGRRDGLPGKITGTSNVYFAKKFGITPVGTIAHEWFMGVAAITDNYEGATEAALGYWVGAFGKGVLAIALTDTFGTSNFLTSFHKPVRVYTAARQGEASSPVAASNKADHASDSDETYADVFTGVRQDSGDPESFVEQMREFIENEKPKGSRTIVFSDALNTDKCLRLKKRAEDAGFSASFGIGTFFTNDFIHASDGSSSKPLNIVIKLSSANGQPAIKISDNIGKNTGDEAKVAEVKRRLGYTEQLWSGGDERRRW